MWTQADFQRENISFCPNCLRIIFSLAGTISFKRINFPYSWEMILSSMNPDKTAMMEQALKDFGIEYIQYIRHIRGSPQYTLFIKNSQKFLDIIDHKVFVKRKQKRIDSLKFIPRNLEGGEKE